MASIYNADIARSPGVDMNKAVCLVAGVGPGNGLTISQRFAAAGYRVAMLARNQATLTELVAAVPDAHGFICDLTEAKSVEGVVAEIREQLGAAEAVVYNAGSGMRGRALDIALGSPAVAWTAIAESVYQRSLQHPSAWTFELDLRPSGERW